MGQYTRFAPFILALGLLAGCGGGGGDGNLEESALVRVVWPGPTGITDQTSIRIRGVSPDPLQVTAVSVDGVAALSGDGFATWEATVPLVPGLNLLDVDVTDAEAGVLFAHVRIEVRSVGQFPLFLRSLALDAAANRLYYVDARLQTLGYVDLATGLRTVVSGDGRGAGVDFVDPEGVALDPTGSRAFVAEGAQGSPGARRVLEVDLPSGDRSIVSGAAVGAGPPNFSDPGGIAYDPLLDIVVVADTGLSALIGFDPDFSDRFEISRDGGGFGSGDDFVIGPFDLAANFDGDTLYVTDRDTIFKVTLSNGARAILSNDETGAGEELQTTTGIVIDGSRLVVGDQGRRRIYGVELTTGDRTVLSGGDVGSGPELDRVIDVESTANPGRVYACDRRHQLFDVQLGTGNRSLVFDDRAGTGRTPDFPSDVAYDPQTGAAFVLDRDDEGRGRILRVSPVSGDRRLFSGAGRGDGPGLPDGFGPMAIDVEGRRLFVFSSQTESIYAVSLGDGDRTLVSGPERGAGTPIESATDLLFDPTSLTLVLLAANQDHLVEIDPASGDRATLSDNSAEFGDPLLVPDSMALDSANNRILVVDNAFPRVLFDVDRTTGVRTVVTTSDDDTGLFPRAESAHLDAAHGRLVIVQDSVANASSPTANITVVGIDLTTGNRTVLSSLEIGEGPNPISPRGADYDPVGDRLFVADLRFGAVFVYDTHVPNAFDRSVLTR